MTPPLTIHRRFWRRRSAREVLNFIEDHTGWRPTPERLEAAFSGPGEVEAVHLVTDGQGGCRIRVGTGYDEPAQ